MTDFLKAQLEVYFIENPMDAEKIGEQVLVNKRSRENAERTRLNIKKKLSGSVDIANRVQKFVDCRTKDTERRELYIVEGDSAMGAVKLSRDAEYQGIMPVSYTHLDVYKRQQLDGGGADLRSGQLPEGPFWSGAAGQGHHTSQRQKEKGSSFHGEDVYKRQPPK